MSERCSKCHRKKRAESRATSPDLCHRTGSPECAVAERAYARGAAAVSTHVRAIVNDTCYDDDLGDVCSMGIASYANAIRYLASVGRVRIHEDQGPMVSGKWA